MLTRFARLATLPMAGISNASRLATDSLVAMLGIAVVLALVAGRPLTWFPSVATSAAILAAGLIVGFWLNQRVVKRTWASIAMVAIDLALGLVLAAGLTTLGAWFLRNVAASSFSDVAPFAWLAGWTAIMGRQRQRAFLARCGTHLVEFDPLKRKWAGPHSRGPSTRRPSEVSHTSFPSKTHMESGVVAFPDEMYDLADREILERGLGVVLGSQDTGKTAFLRALAFKWSRTRFVFFVNLESFEALELDEKHAIHELDDLVQELKHSLVAPAVFILDDIHRAPLTAERLASLLQDDEHGLRVPVAIGAREFYRAAFLETRRRQSMVKGEESTPIMDAFFRHDSDRVPIKMLEHGHDICMALLENATVSKRMELKGISIVEAHGALVARASTHLPTFSVLLEALEDIPEAITPDHLTSTALDGLLHTELDKRLRRIDEALGKDAQAVPERDILILSWLLQGTGELSVTPKLCSHAVMCSLNRARIALQRLEDLGLVRKRDGTSRFRATFHAGYARILGEHIMKQEPSNFYRPRPNSPLHAALMEGNIFRAFQGYRGTLPDVTLYRVYSLLLQDLVWFASPRYDREAGHRFLTVPQFKSLCALVASTYEPVEPQVGASDRNWTRKIWVVPFAVAAFAFQDVSTRPSAMSLLADLEASLDHRTALAGEFFVATIGALRMEDALAGFIHGLDSVELARFARLSLRGFHGDQRMQDQVIGIMARGDFVKHCLSTLTVDERREAGNLLVQSYDDIENVLSLSRAYANSDLWQGVLRDQTVRASVVRQVLAMATNDSADIRVNAFLTLAECSSSILPVLTAPDRNALVQSLLAGVVDEDERVRENAFQVIIRDSIPGVLEKSTTPEARIHLMTDLVKSMDFAARETTVAAAQAYFTLYTSPAFEVEVPSAIKAIVDAHISYLRQAPA